MSLSQVQRPADGPPEWQDDKALVLAFQGGFDGAYQDIFERYSGRVHGLCYRMLGQREDAQEASQETFLRVYQALGRFNGRYQLGPWITRIATNVCLDHIRARSRKPTESTPLEVIDQYVGEASEDTDPEEVFLRSSEGRHVRKTLASLPPMHRAAIVLRDFQGLAYDEIAAALNLSDGQVKALIHRARKSFKRSWSAQILAALVPTGLFQRIRRLASFGREQSAQTAASAAQVSTAPASLQAATSCSSVLQQCGVFMAERISPVVVAAIVGSAGVGAAALTRAPVRSVEVEVASRPALDGGNEEHARSERRERQDAADEAVTEPVVTAESVAEPNPEPSPAESEPPSEPPDEVDEGAAPEPTDGEEEPSEPEPAPTHPEPEGFAFVFASDVAASDCGCFGDTQVTAESVYATDDGLIGFTQSLSGSIQAAGVPSHGLRLEQRSDSAGHQMTFWLSTRDGSYRYAAGGAVVSTETTAWGGWSYTYQGTYKLSSRPGYSEDVPENGTYTAVVQIARRSSRAVSVHISLAEG